MNREEWAQQKFGTAFKNLSAWAKDDINKMVDGVNDLQPQADPVDPYLSNLERQVEELKKRTEELEYEIGILKDRADNIEGGGY